MKNNCQPIETYFQDLRDIRQSGGGVDEASYYGSLEKLLNEIGKTMKPQVRCIIQLKNRGAGHPDGGLFTKDQWEHGDVQTPLLGQTPGRGVIEMKPTNDDTLGTAGGEQVSKYWKTYQLVLVTNFHDFVLVGKDDKGKPFNLETYHLGTSDADFWTRTLHPKDFAKEKGATFSEYLRRTMLQGAPVSSPKDLAWFLASYARTASSNIEEKDIPAMNSVRAALEAALGLKFQGKKGEHFFRSTLVQTIFYGLFSAWVLWSKRRSPKSTDLFTWHDALWELKVPVMQALFGQIVTPAHVGTLELKDILELASSTLNRVDRTSFFNTFEDDKAVQYFYEPFLEAFDPELRKQFGVWFTPSEIVHYMVDRVDTVLKQELNIPDGLADPSVFVLDPCCGTGSYLVEVLKRIHQTLKSKGEDALIADDLKQAALKRVFGFEILPAPFVVSHMQLGFLLQNLGAPLSETSNEHAGVYLTNALTGWEPLDPEKEKAFQGMLIGFPQLLEEQIGASKVKQQVPILVILGNPPYDAFAGVATTKEERQFIAPYKKGLREKWGIKKYNLDELYIRFFRMAEHRIAEQTGKGIVCFISNFSYLSDPSYVVMRERFLDEFDCLWIDNMNGSSRETGKRTPDGKPDPSVFSTQYNKAGIKLGTAVALLVRKLEKEENAILRYRQFWGKNKRNDLLNSLDVSDIDSDYQLWKPGEQNRYSFRPSDVSGDYQSWPKLIDIFEQMLVGLEECRGGALIDIDKNQLEFRMKKYFDKNTDWDSLKNLKTGLTEDAVGFNAKNVRNKTVLTEEFNLQNIVSYMARPFDKRWCYYSTHSTLWNRPRPRLYAQCVHNNKFLISRMNTAATPEGMPIFVSNTIYDKQAINRNPGAFPLFLYGEDLKARKKPKEQIHLITTDANVPPKANLSQAAREYLLSMKIDNPDLNIHNGSLLWMHVLAIVCSRAYLDENADGIRNNWPSVPLPKQKELLESSAIIGEKLASLMDTQTSIIGITTSPISPGIQNIGVITRCDGSQLLPKELEVTVGWGHAVNGGIVMPGKGKVVERDYTMAEEQPTAEIATKFDVLPEKIFELLGKRTFDIYLNEVAYWKNIPAKVWEYTIGGYQVMKKWLSYREATLLGRPLSTDEAREFRDMARRITAIILLQPALDENYQQCKHDVYSWKILDV